VSNGSLHVDRLIAASYLSVQRGDVIHHHDVHSRKVEAVLQGTQFRANPIRDRPIVNVGNQSFAAHQAANVRPPPRTPQLASALRTRRECDRGGDGESDSVHRSSTMSDNYHRFPPVTGGQGKTPDRPPTAHRPEVA
jgi:hypothetical protein